MEKGQGAPRRQRRPAGRKSRASTKPTKRTSSSAERGVKLPETDVTAVREMLRQWEVEGDAEEQRDTWEILQQANPRKFPGLSPDVIWPETGVEAALKMLRQWDAEDAQQERNETGDLLMSAWDENRQPVHEAATVPECDLDAAIALVRRWEEEGDEVEQRETWEILKEALGGRIASNRPAIPAE